ncbi:hypothetical protein [Mesorhizobium neociceri]|uniref:Uncharacterized protein n=1 Tax=Mesorhizobium neociceri TaxID=1307853 RepID=A0A838AXP4_9HYPH|nr:hypothetical protein [Mesorhizobium neociceri]MBA1139308.1 hypothetical protein [Mesorhizobium neociceri]
MPVNITNSQSNEVHTSVPYPAFFSPTRSNRGFVDLRGRPELAAGIAEAVTSKALRAFLVRIAATQTSLFSIGCDLGHHVDPAAPKGRRRVAGGYIQLTSSHYDLVRPDDWARLCNGVSDTLQQSAPMDEWDVHFKLEPVWVEIDDVDQATGAVHVAFYANAKTHHDALRSRERLIAAIDVGFSDESIDATLRSVACRSTG